jgi:hypothetical protein
MRFNPKGAFESILRRGGEPNKDGNDPVSIVLLLREPMFKTLDQLRLAAEKTFCTSFSEDKESGHYVIQVAFLTILKAGPHSLSFLNYRKPYGDNSYDLGRSWPKPSQRQAWADHTAWTAVDYVKGGADLELEYAVLAKLCAEMLDANCVGLYIPGKRTFIPNDDYLQEQLQRMAASGPHGVV